MTLSLHKLWAGAGYEYLTRRVARLDATSPGRESLAAYYSARGETPGVWVGSGLAGVEGLTEGAMVQADQMRLLFALGLHPLADIRASAAREAGASVEQVDRVRRLGAPFRMPTTENPFAAEVSRRLEAAASTTSEAPPLLDARARMTSDVAAEWFERDHGRAPLDERELAAAVVRWTRPVAQPVAGFDLTFSPVKSVSALWAVADQLVADQIEQAHRGAVQAALRFIEEQVLFTREGRQGVRQVEVRGLVGTAFTHRDSRAGDPDLHTHVAVANKVQTRDGRWLAIDGRALYASVVAASETYNIALEAHLGERLGVRFAERAGAQRGRPVREIIGVDPTLNRRWSQRRQAIDVRRDELARTFHQSAGRPPTREETWLLAQQATLETRDRKHDPRSLLEQRATWRAEAEQALGGAAEVRTMVAEALHPEVSDAPTVDAAWIAGAAAQVLATMEGERATWTRAHLRAEALRQVRSASASAEMAEHITDLVAAEALNRSVPLGSADPLDEPAPLRRSDGTSVYDHAYRNRFTSTRILSAERAVMTAAGRRDGRRLSAAAVEEALAQAALGGVTLNEGQASLVQHLAGSGARVQLALAPAGTGKTTALRVLAQAWTMAGGSVLGLAPSAAAAAVLAENIDAATDTVAKLVWSVQHPHREQPVWMAGIGPGTLVVVDEAGLADTLSLDTVVAHVLRRGGSVRLVGDDHQLGAVGAGGLLRDLDARYGAARLSEVVRFTDPAEAAASLALREGRVEALGFYLDQRRIHVGDGTTTLDALFDGWVCDRAAGLDSLMLAPTNDLAAELNVRARTSRLPRGTLEREVHLADGNLASEGDVVLSRSNDRRIRVTGAGWVRNGDRWLVTQVRSDGALRVRGLRSGGTATLPHDYVAASVQLGYASTVHSAQGVTCDTVHGLVRGHESRPQLYTLLTRGRQANHAYLELAGPGELHDLARPGDAPLTPTEVLEQVLSRDGTTRSATTERQTTHDPVAQLGIVCARHVDALYQAVIDTTSAAARGRLTQLSERLVPGITRQPAWPALQSELLLTDDPGRRLQLAVAHGTLRAACDPAAVLHHRLLNQTLGSTNRTLPWISAIPDRIEHHPTWGPYLTAQSAQLAELAAQVVHRIADRPLPRWARELPVGLAAELMSDVELWRAGVGVPEGDLTPTGARRQSGRLADWQDRLDQRLSLAAGPLNDWSTRLTRDVPAVRNDPFLNRLALRLSRLSAAGIDVWQELHAAVQERSLPDDHAAAALWWRLQRRLPQPKSDKARSARGAAPAVQAPTNQHPQRESDPAHASLPDTARADTALLVAGLLRLTAQPGSNRLTALPGGVGDPLAQQTRGRLLEVTGATQAFYRKHFPGSWSQAYLAERLGVDLTQDERFQPGQAPAGWHALVRHLRRLDFTEIEMVAAGVAARASNGQLIDRFRDRLVLPIYSGHHELIGFVGRRRPDLVDSTNRTPKYLNSPTSALFTKGNELYGGQVLDQRDASADPDATMFPRTPVLVEGPLDAIAVTLAGEGRFYGLSPLGTTLTTRQAQSVAALTTQPVVATDPDHAGKIAARRDFWILTGQGCDPAEAHLPDGLDPANLLRLRGAQHLLSVVASTHPLGDRLIDESISDPALPGKPLAALQVVAARPPHTWVDGLARIALRSGAHDDDLRTWLVPVANEWTHRSKDGLDAAGPPHQRVAPNTPSVSTYRHSDAPRR